MWWLLLKVGARYISIRLSWPYMFCFDQTSLEGDGSQVPLQDGVLHADHDHPEQGSIYSSCELA